MASLAVTTGLMPKLYNDFMTNKKPFQNQHYYTKNYQFGLIDLRASGLSFMHLKN
jgi:hypothetical protein